ncbi:hypothetical protein GCM10028807_58130 [Spirosoma daeguense]
MKSETHLIVAYVLMMASIATIIGVCLSVIYKAKKSPPINHRDLLKKYMDGVSNVEGVTFIRECDVTPAEYAELAAIEKELIEG